MLMMCLEMLLEWKNFESRILKIGVVGGWRTFN